MVAKLKNALREPPPAHSLRKDEIDIDGNFIAAKDFLCGDIQYQNGDDFVRTSVTTRTLRQLYDQNFITHKLRLRPVRSRKTKED